MASANGVPVVQTKDFIRFLGVIVIIYIGAFTAAIDRAFMQPALMPGKMPKVSLRHLRYWPGTR